MNLSMLNGGRDGARDLLARHSYRELQSRVEFTDSRWGSLFSTAEVTQARLDTIVPSGESGTLLRDRAFAYATGSVARGEAALGSDLDVFVMSAPGQNRTDFVETSHIVSFLDIVRQENDFRAFSRGGEFVRVHDFAEVINQMGGRFDDSTNTFTARILLLLESRALFNVTAYELAKEQILDRYWSGRPVDERFLPIMLVNDIRRWWGAVGLNFEEKHRPTPSATAEKKAERALANLKLRYTRLLSVYSSLAALVWVSDEKGLLRADLEAVLAMTPVERIALIVGGSEDDVAQMGLEILRRYDKAMVVLGSEKSGLIRDLQDPTFAKPLKAEAYEFHRVFTDFFSQVGGGKTLFQYSIA